MLALALTMSVLLAGAESPAAWRWLTIRPPVVTLPDWSAPPSGESLIRVFPECAAREDIAGAATLDCTVTENGLLEDCRVTAEDPPGYDFGAAALALVPELRMRPRTVDGVPEASQARVVIAFPVTPARLRWLDAAFRCYGWRAALYEAFPASAEYREMAGRLLAALAVTAAEAGYRPSDVEARLTAARLAAGAVRGTQDAKGYLVDCQLAEAPEAFPR